MMECADPLDLMHILLQMVVVITLVISSKHFCSGADFVMIGGMLAGHDECDGEIVNGKMQFYRNGIWSAMDRHNVPHRNIVVSRVRQLKFHTKAQ